MQGSRDEHLFMAHRIEDPIEQGRESLSMLRADAKADDISDGHLLLLAVG